MAFTVVFGLVFTMATAFVSMALLVRTSFGRVPHAITFLPAPLVLFNSWTAAWFVFECLRQFALTSLPPPSALRLVAFVFLVAAVLLVAFLYASISVVHQLLGGRVARRIRRLAKYAALGYTAALIVGWSAYHFNADSALFVRLRASLGITAFPIALASWLWLLAGAKALPEAGWRSRVRGLARQYVGLFSVVFVAAALRDRLVALGPAVPLAIDVLVALAYTIVTVVWVESSQEPRPGGSAPVHHAMP